MGSDRDCGRGKVIVFPVVGARLVPTQGAGRGVTQTKQYPENPVRFTLHLFQRPCVGVSQGRRSRGATITAAPFCLCATAAEAPATALLATGVRGGSRADVQAGTRGEGHTRGDEGEAKEEPDEIPGRGPFELDERPVEVARNERASGAKTMDLIADRPAGRVHGQENAMRRPRRRQANRPTPVGILAIARRPRRTALSPA